MLREAMLHSVAFGGGSGGGKKAAPRRTFGGAGDADRGSAGGGDPTAGMSELEKKLARRRSAV